MSPTRIEIYMQIDKLYGLLLSLSIVPIRHLEEFDQALIRRLDDLDRQRCRICRVQSL